ncbi:MAG: sugar transferase, partial [Actinomycetota bacterium]
MKIHTSPSARNITQRSASTRLAGVPHRLSDPGPNPGPVPGPGRTGAHRSGWRLLLLVMALADGSALAITRLATGALLESPGRTPRSFDPPPPLGRPGMWLALWWMGLFLAGLHDHRRIENPAEELRLIIRGVTMGAAIAGVASVALEARLPRIFLLTFWALALLSVGMERRLIRKFVHALRRRGRLRRRALVVGADSSAMDLAEAVERASWSGLDVVGFVSLTGAERGKDFEPPVVGAADELPELVGRLKVHEVIVAPDIAGNGQLPKVVSALDGVPVDLRVAPGLEGFLASRLAIYPLGDRPLVSIERVELRPQARVIKRAVDLLAGSILLILAFPLIMGCALAVRLEGPGPVLFRQRRVGKDGRLFTVLKIRSMVVGAEALRSQLEASNEAGGLLFKMREDPRITRVGRFLRRTGLDELPQLLNVAAGHMS